MGRAKTISLFLSSGLLLLALAIPILFPTHSFAQKKQKFIIKNGQLELNQVRAPVGRFTRLWTFLPSLNGGHGLSWADIDESSLPDLYFTINLIEEGDRSDLLMCNPNGKKLYEEGALRGVDDFDGGSHGAVFADLDNDGDYDLVNGSTYQLGGVDGEPNNVFQNDGTGFFTDVTAPDIQGRAESTRGVLCFDMDSDGDLDLFMVSNYRGSGDPHYERNEVYLNDGSFQFTEVTSGALYSAQAGQGATDTDFDCDGDIDVLAANRGGHVNILRNNGDGTFSQVYASSIGLSHEYGDGGDGVTTADVNSDGAVDVLFTKIDQGKLYLNDGEGNFTFAQLFSGTHGYMGGFADLDNDCDLDLYFAGDDRIYLNDGNGAFFPGPQVPVAGIDDPRTVAFADMDNDGDMDFAVSAKGSRSFLYRNNLNSRNWIRIRLVSPQGQAGAFGAKVWVFPDPPGGIILGYKEAKSSHGYLAQDDPVLHFGLGDHAIVNVYVIFSDGSWVMHRDIPSNQTYLID